MTEPTQRTTIIVAVIALLGTIAAAVISNWDKIFGGPVKGTPPPEVVKPSVQGAQKPPAEGVKPSVQGAATPSSIVPTNSTQNSLKVLSITPPVTTVLHAPTAFQVVVEYTLAMPDRAVLVFGSQLYKAKSGRCVGLINYSGYEIRKPLYGGTHRLSFDLPSGAERVNGRGAIGFYAIMLDAVAFENGKKLVVAAFPAAADAYCYEVAN